MNLAKPMGWTFVAVLAIWLGACGERAEQDMEYTKKNEHEIPAMAKKGLFDPKKAMQEEAKAKAKESKGTDTKK